MTRPERLAWGAGGVGLLLSLLGWWLRPADFAYAWLAALATWIGWPLGCLALLLTHALTGGRWGETIRPQLLAGIVTLPLLLPALIPLLLELQRLYPWLHADIQAHLGNRFYLNTPFAIGRGIGYLVVWFGLGGLALAQLRRGRSLYRLAPFGLILLGLSVTFAAVDATMSLDPHFNSSDYGMIAGAEAGLFALAICVLGAAAGPPLPPAALADLGRLLLGLLVLWAYLDFVQFLIVWQSDLPKESTWYLRRIRHNWAPLIAILTIGHFVLPFFALMSGRLRRTPRGIGSIAALLIVMAVFRGWWLVLPAGDHSIGWIDIAAALAFAGLASGAALRWRYAGPATVQVRHG